MLIILGKDAHQYGKQRVWGSVGWGGVSIITGWLIDCYSDGKSTKNYKPAIIVTIVFMLLDLFVAFKISVCILENRMNKNYVKKLFF